MLTESQLGGLNIQGKNSLKEDTQKNISENYSNCLSSNEYDNFILNSNLENGNSIK